MPSTGCAGLRLHLLFFRRSGRLLSHCSFFADLLYGVRLQTRAQGCALTLGCVRAGTPPRELRRRFGACDGIILAATELEPADLAGFTALNVPLVTADNAFPGTGVYAVVFDSTLGLQKALRYLISLDHIRLGYLASSLPCGAFARREQSYYLAMSRIGFPVEARMIHHLPPDPREACIVMGRLLAEGLELPDALFCIDDRIAAGCLRALQNAGIRVPSELSVLGFGGLRFRTPPIPSLTTLRADGRRMGGLAVELLLSLIREGAGAIRPETSLEVRLAVRESTDLSAR